MYMYIQYILTYKCTYMSALTTTLKAISTASTSLIRMRELSEGVSDGDCGKGTLLRKKGFASQEILKVLFEGQRF